MGLCPTIRGALQILSLLNLLFCAGKTRTEERCCKTEAFRGEKSNRGACKCFLTLQSKLKSILLPNIQDMIMGGRNHALEKISRGSGSSKRGEQLFFLTHVPLTQVDLCEVTGG